jgi:hypothetical protein
LNEIDNGLLDNMSGSKSRRDIDFGKSAGDSRLSFPWRETDEKACRRIADFLEETNGA